MSLSFSFALKELIKENLEKTNFQRVFTSSVEESKEFLISTDKEFIIFISEYLKDGLGTKLFFIFLNVAIYKMDLFLLC